MHARVAGFLLLVLVVGTAFASSVGAAEVEITPFAGYTMGGEFQDAQTGTSLSFDSTSSYGIMLDIRQMDDSWIELYFSHQPTRLKADQGPFVGDPLFDVDIEYYHLGGTYGTATGAFRPYVAGTIGATYMAPKGTGLHSETKLSLALGGGAKFSLTKRLGIRVDARWFGTFFNGSGSAFCSGGTCLIDVQGSVLSQLTANAGVILAF